MPNHPLQLRTYLLHPLSTTPALNAIFLHIVAALYVVLYSAVMDMYKRVKSGSRLRCLTVGVVVHLGNASGWGAWGDELPGVFWWIFEGCRGGGGCSVWKGGEGLWGFALALGGEA